MTPDFLVATPQVPVRRLRDHVFAGASFSDLFRPGVPDTTGQLQPLADWEPLPQVRYLARYLADLGCTHVLVESHYLDRDYAEDFSAFYARSFVSYPNHCARLHFFRGQSTDGLPIGSRAHLAALRASVVGAEPLTGRDQAYQTACDTLTNAYLGFTVVRPLPRSPVGRTVVRPYSESDMVGSVERLQVSRTYRAHVAGFALEVRGVAFQQQDRGTSACATAAVWSAMHTLEFAHGHLMTPAEITRLATLYSIPEGRALPSAGLTVGQVCEAIRGAGLAAYRYRYQGPATALEFLHLAALSRLPAIAMVYREDKPFALHAVTIVGGKIDTTYESTAVEGAPDGARAGRLTALYVHDDRIGPYVRADLSTSPAPSAVTTSSSPAGRAPAPSVPAVPDHGDGPAARRDRGSLAVPGQTTPGWLRQAGQAVMTRLGRSGAAEDADSDRGGTTASVAQPIASPSVIVPRVVAGNGAAATDPPTRFILSITDRETEKTERFVLTDLIFPVHVEMRMAFPDLVKTARKIVARAEAVLNVLYDVVLPVEYELRIVSGVDYVRDLLTRFELSPGQQTVLTEEVALSRYVAIVRLWLGGFVFADVVLDTTGTELHAPQLAVVDLSNLGEVSQAVAEGVARLSPNTRTILA